MICFRAVIVLLACFYVVDSRCVTLDEVLNVYCMNTAKVRSLRMEYANSRLAYENYRKGFLPTLSFGVSPVSFNRSLRLLQNPLTGDYSYVNDYSNASSAEITITQRIGITGGTLIASSSLNFLREFSYNRNNFNTSPVYISYTQPLRGGRYLYEHTRNVERMRYDLARRAFVAGVAAERQSVAALYMAMYVSKHRYETAVSKAAIADSLLELAKVKLLHGAITRYECNQIELQNANSHINVRRNLLDYDNAKADILLELDIDDIEVERFDVSALPRSLDIAEVKKFVNANNPHTVQQALRLEQARIERYNSRMSTRFGGNVTLMYGLNQYATTLARAYTSPERRQAIGVTFSIPVFEWGVNGNKRRMADNAFSQAQIEVAQNSRRFWENLSKQVMEYNYLMASFENVERQHKLAMEQYVLAVDRFRNGNMSTFELTAIYEQVLTTEQNVCGVEQTLCNTYHTICAMSHYDFMTRRSFEQICVALL